MPGATLACALSTTRPSMRQRDYSMKRVARLRDLKKRACHSHLSSRIAPQPVTRDYFFPPSFSSSSLAKGESAAASLFFSVVA